MNSSELDPLRHSCAHLLAAAVKALYPDAKLAIGPAIENGFYYDIAFSTPLTEDDLSRIEKKMAELLPAWTEFSSRTVTQDEAKGIFADNPYKLELIDEIAGRGEEITLYKSGEFEDLCRGGHSDNPAREIGAFKLLSLAGAYWRGNEKNTMLTRIYGTCFPTKQALDEHLSLLEEAKKRDHKRIGRELELFYFSETSPGMAYWLPNGLVIYNELYRFAREMYEKYGYHEVATPLLNKKELYETSGHWEHYKDDMFISDMGEHEVFGVKPMNCPNAMTIFGMKNRSYNELPMRLADTSPLHRHELSGTLNGLFRIRQFRQDDAHIFLTSDMVVSEFGRIMEMVREMYAPFNLSYRFRFGTKPEKALGENKDWEVAEKELREVLAASGQEFFTAEGEGAFYGPKVDILMQDSLGREWQTGTIQLDLQQPKRFGLSYVEASGEEKTPFVFHRAIYGSFERFLGILIEHWEGKFPLWLAPIQVTVIPISDKVLTYAGRVESELRDAGIRVRLDARKETMQGKIRDATLQKVPNLCIIGGQEESEAEKEGKTIVTVRSLNGEQEKGIELSALIQKLKKDIEKKT